MTSPFRETPEGIRDQFLLDPNVCFLNHGSFGACPRVVFEQQAEWRLRMEREPVLFLGRELEGLLDEVRVALGRFLGADPDDLALVPNATAGVNTVLRSLRFQPGDEILVTDHEYDACRNAAVAVAQQTGARIVTAGVPFPLRDASQVRNAVLACLTPRTKLVLIDHVTSQTGLIFPVEQIIADCAERGVDVLVDGAHAPGMLPLSVGALCAAYYTGNCHKWLCAPKGAAFLHVRRDRQHNVLPLSTSHGLSSKRTDRSRFRLQFDWQGTLDPSAYLCIPEALSVLSSWFSGGVEALQQHNRHQVLAGRALLCQTLGVDEPAPADMIGSLAAIPLPAPIARLAAPHVLPLPLQEALFQNHRIEVPIIPWPLSAEPRRFNLRISAQVYNSASEYQQLALALASVQKASG